MALVTAGTACPAFTVQAAVSGREISPAALKGKRAVLVLHGVKTSDAPKEVGKVVRAKHPGADVVVANIVNLKTMGGMWKRVAEAQMKSTYEKMAGKLKENGTANPEDFVIICPDWENAIAPLFGAENTDSEAAVVVLGKDGKVHGAASGAGLGEKALGFLR
jgi:hypothetical protein